MDSWEHWEGIAREVLEATGFDDGPVDAVHLAHLCGMRVEWGGPARQEGRVIYVPRRLRPTRLHGQVAHELGHHLLGRAGAEDSELAARYLAGALLVPWGALRRDLQRVGPDLPALRELHPNASWELLLHRVVQVGDYEGLIIDDARRWRRVARAGHRRPSRLERELADLALEQDAVVDRDGVVAVPIIDPPWARVVILG